MDNGDELKYYEPNQPTFSMEDNLPSLPLPTLKSTLHKYLDSIRPFVTENEYTKTQKLVEEFENGIGVKLQELLANKAKFEKNWLENFWIDWAYLEQRVPLAPFLNTGGHYFDIDFINKENFKGFSIQNAVASLQTYYTILYFDELRKETIPIERSKNKYLSMNQHRRLFNTCRIPNEKKDQLDTHFRTISEGPMDSYIIILYRYRFYKLDIYHPVSKNLLNISEIYEILNNMVRKYTNVGDGIGMGALTADNRDDWAYKRRYLISLDEQNEEKLKIIEKSIMIVALDEQITQNNDELFRCALASNPKNRFFDKSYQLIVTKNGHLTINTDHTPFDGIISVNLSIYVRNKMVRAGMNDVNKVDIYDVRKNIPEVEPIKLVYDEKIEEYIDYAVNLFNKNTSIIDIKTIHIDFCTKFHVKLYKIHPDTFVQMAIQLAYYDLHKRPAPTYETASTRYFYHGRTETLRTCTEEVYIWCKEMCKNEKTKFELYNLLKIAYTKHDKLMYEASENRGCDRHLLGLMLTAETMNIDLPELFKDISWIKSGSNGNFLISSSCLGFSDTYGGCYPMCMDGYGIFYRVGDDGITFFVSGYNTSKETNVKLMIDSLKNSVKLVQDLFEIYIKQKNEQ